MKLDPGIHIVMHSVLFLKPGVTPVGKKTGLTSFMSGPTASCKFLHNKSNLWWLIPKKPGIGVWKTFESNDHHKHKKEKAKAK